jgi:hypothetical protein
MKTATMTTRSARKRRPTKRGYSTAFTPTGNGEKYFIDRIPSTLWRDVRSKAARDGVSVRHTILTLLEDWTKTDRSPNQ